MERRKRRGFTPEYRVEAVQVVHGSGKSLPQVVKDLDLTELASGNRGRGADKGKGKDLQQAR